MKKGKIRLTLLLVVIIALAFSISASADWLDPHYDGAGGVSSQYDNEYLSPDQNALDQWSEIWHCANNNYQVDGHFRLSRITLN